MCNHSVPHYGILEADEEWTGDAEHIIWAGQAVRVPSGVTLTIADGTVVKFCNGAQLVVEEGGELVFDKTREASEPGYAFTHSAIPWTEQSEETHEEGSAWRSGAIDHSGQSWMETTFAGPGTISFWWKVSSESGYDHLRFHLDGSQQDSISGTSDWAGKNYEVGEGSHTFRWEYSKDGSVSNGEDCGWVGDIVWTPVTPTPAGSVFTHIADNEEGVMDDVSYELELNGEVTVNGLQPTLRHTRFIVELQPLTAIGCRETPFLARAGETVTLTTRYAGGLDGRRLEWSGILLPSEVELLPVAGNPYQIQFTMPSAEVMVKCVAWRILDETASTFGVVDTRSSFGGRLLHGNVRLSPVALTAASSPQITINGQNASGWSGANPVWTSAAVPDGYYSAVLREGGQTFSAEMAVINSSGVAVHGGVLEANESWNTEKVHIVQYIVRVPSGKTLTVAANAVVKVCEGAGFIVDEGGKLVMGDGSVITHITDDSAGGDTNMDASATTPPSEEAGEVSDIIFDLGSEDALETIGTPAVKTFTSVARTITLLPGWNAMLFDFILDEASTKTLRQLCAMQLDLVNFAYIQCEEFLPNTMYWIFSPHLQSLRITGLSEIEDVPGEALSQWMPYGNAYGIVPANCEIYEWCDGQFRRFTGTTFLPGHGYFLLQQE